MYKVILIFTFLILSANTFIFADDSEQVITLKDGSQIKGVLSGIDNGIYTVKTPIIGDVHVAASDVSSITNGNAAVAAPPVNNAMPNYSLPAGAMANTDQQVLANQQRLMSNPQSMAILTQMTQNPEIMQALQDPALVQAVQNHDYQAVQSNPVIQKLMSDPQMQALIQKLAAQQQQSGSSQ
jgi:hypothetical protein